MLMLAAAALSQIGPFREQTQIMVTSASTDTTITIPRTAVGVNLYAYDDDLWVSYAPGGEAPFLIPAEKAYYIQARISSLVLHRSVSATSVLVTLAQE